MKAAAAAAAARDDEPEDMVTEIPAALVEAQPVAPADLQPSPARAVGRPKGRRAVAARQTVYLDDARHAALARIAEDRGRSIHSLILEGIDHVIGKPTAPGWQ
jgi:hypothetical protein